MTGHSTNIFLISPQAKSPQARGKLVERLEKCFNTAKEKTAKAKQVADDIQEHFNELSSLTLEIHLRTNFQEAIEQSALKIQKVFRGYTVRSYYDEEIVKIRKKTVNGWLSELKKSDDKNIFNTGRKPYWAATIINRFLKRMLFVFKIRRIQKAYMHFERVKQEEGEVWCRRGLQICHANFTLKNIRFERYRAMRLLQIKDNLALLIIKNYYDRHHLSFSAIMKLFKRYKRKLKIHKSSSVHDKSFDGYSTRDHTSTRSDIFTNSSNENLRNPDNLGNILECASLTSTEFLQIEQTRKDKIQNGKISYNIQRAKEPIAVLPYLYQKDIQEEVSPPSHYTTATTALISRMLTSHPQRQNPKKQALPLPDHKDS